MVEGLRQHDRKLLYGLCDRDIPAIHFKFVQENRVFLEEFYIIYL